MDRYYCQFVLGNQLFGEMVMKRKLANLKSTSQLESLPDDIRTSKEAFACLLKKMSYLKDKKAVEQVTKAYLFAEEKHKKQKRQSGDPYILHPISVAIILTSFHVDVASLVSGLLHDVVEDTGTSLEEIKKEFGETIADLVDGLTKIGKIRFRSNQERMAENFRKMILAMAKDLRVILVKLADRLHNIRTIDVLSEERKLRIAKETLEIYAPLANRLGIYGIKNELEDHCLKVLKYQVYKEIATSLSRKKKERELYITEVRDILAAELKKYGFRDLSVYGRPKHIYSIYRKMVVRQLAFTDIHDLFGFRVIVESIKDCYEVLGVVHSMWKPMPGKFKDYIAMPKANLYQSLHTTVIRPNGSTAEIQIRTFDMHDICENGIAAHWSYKEKHKSPIKATDLEKFTWMRQMMELQRELKDPSEFLAAVKVDLFDEEIFVFTPKGDVKQLSVDATALDFAFAIHTDVGLTTVGAKVNGKITPLRSKLQSGDIVEIITSNNQHPSKDWLNYVVSSKARNKIRSYLRSEQRENSKRIGRTLLEHELAKLHIDLDKDLRKGKLDHLIKNAKESGIDEMLIAIGYGKINAKELVHRSFPKESKDPLVSDQPSVTKAPARTKTGGKLGILVSGLSNIMVTFGKCCNPLPGEDVIGFITRGRGVSIHRDDCLRALDLDPARKVEVQWSDDQESSTLHTVTLKVVTQERTGILADVTAAISNSGVNIRKAQVALSPGMKGVLEFEVALANLQELNKVIKTIESIRDVIFVERKNHSRRH